MDRDGGPMNNPKDETGAIDRAEDRFAFEEIDEILADTSAKDGPDGHPITQGHTTTCHGDTCSVTCKCGTCPPMPDNYYVSG